MLWLKEPVRVYLYSILGPLVTVLAGYGLLDGQQAVLWIALAAAVLGVPAVEVARREVTPLVNPKDVLGRPLTPDPPPSNVVRLAAYNKDGTGGVV